MTISKVLAAALCTLLPVLSAAQEITLERTLPECYTYAGNVSVTLDMDVPTTNVLPNGIIVTEDIPAGWSPISSTPEADSYDPVAGTLSWVFFGDDIIDKRIAYQLDVPGSFSGPATFAAFFDVNDTQGDDVTTTGPVDIIDLCPCDLLATVSETMFPSAGGTGTASVTANHGYCEWSMSSPEGWIVPDSGGPFTGTRDAGYSVLANNGLARTGSLFVAGEEFVLFQDSGCSFTLTSASRIDLPALGDTDVSITASASDQACTWTAEADANWIANLQPTSGSGDVAITFDAEANYGLDRTATITVAGLTVTVFQPAGCQFILTSADTIAAPAEGITSGTVTMIASNPDCPWEALISESWVSPLGAASGLGDVTFPFEVLPNVGPARTATVTIGGQTITIDQASGCGFELVSQTPALHPGDIVSSGVLTLAATSPDCPVNIVTDDEWITPNQDFQVDSFFDVFYEIDVNDGPARTGTITIEGGIAGPVEVQINQASGCGIELVSQTPQVHPADPATTGALTLAASSPACPVNVNSSDPWIHPDPNFAVDSFFDVFYEIDPNPGPARTGTITVEGPADGPFDVRISQDGGCAFELVGVPAITVPSDGMTTMTLAARTSSLLCPFEPLSDVNWITITGLGENGQDQFLASLEILPNPGPQRVGTVNLEGIIVTFTQLDGCAFELIPSTASFPVEGGAGSTTVTASDSLCSWTAMVDVGWIALDATEGQGTQALGYTVAENTGLARTGVISVDGAAHTVTQAGAIQPELLVSPSFLDRSVLVGAQANPGTIDIENPSVVDIPITVSVDTVPVEIVALSLRGVDPIDIGQGIYSVPAESTGYIDVEFLSGNLESGDYQSRIDIEAPAADPDMYMIDIFLTVLSRPTLVCVDDDFPNPVVGEDPDGQGPATLYGDENDPNSPPDADAFDTIHEALASAGVGTAIKVSEGYYAESAPIDIQLTGLKIYGWGTGEPADTRATVEDKNYVRRDGPGESILTLTGEAALTISAGNVTVAGMTIVKPEGGAALTLNGEHARLAHNVISTGLPADGQSAPVDDTRIGVDINAMTAALSWNYLSGWGTAVHAGPMDATGGIRLVGNAFANNYDGARLDCTVNAVVIANSFMNNAHAGLVVGNLGSSYEMAANSFYVPDSAYGVYYENVDASYPDVDYCNGVQQVVDAGTAYWDLTGTGARTNDPASVTFGSALGSPFDPVAGADADIDDLADPFETILATSTAVKDTDRDGIEDAVEIALGTDPTDIDDPIPGGYSWRSADTDLDRIPPLFDIDNDGTDFDGDTFADFYELAMRTSIIDPDSTPPVLGDIDNSGDFDVADGFNLLFMFQTNSLPPYRKDLDLNRDGVIDFWDGIIYIHLYLGVIESAPVIPRSSSK